MSDEGNEESPLRRPRRTIKRVTVLSDTDTDSDGSVAPPATRRKRLRVLSDDGSDSSGSSVVMRRKRTLPQLRDSDADSDTSGWATDHSDAARPASAGAASDSSDGNSDKCSICLLRFRDQEIGTPQTCEHIFCLDCIIEWSRNVNTCPVDRMTFTSIVVRACAGGRVLRTVPVKAPERRPSVELLVEEDPTPCEICRSTENEETMLLCDSCDLGYHMQCLTPPLTEVPTDEWHCPNCDLLSVIRISELDDLFNEIVDMDLPLGPRPTPLRVPRQVRRSGRRPAAEDGPSTSSSRSDRTQEAPSTSRGSRTQSGNTSARHTTRSRATKRRKRRRTTKTVIIEYELEENGKFPITKTVKRKVKKRKSRARPRTAARRAQVRAGVRARLRGLAGAAGGASTGGCPLEEQRRRAGLAPLSLFGDAYGLDLLSDDEDVAEAEGGLAVAARPTSAVLSAYRQARRKMISIPSPPHASSAPDLLGSILESQTLLHSKKSIVSIAVDGKVDIKIESRERPKKVENREERLDLSKGEDAAKKTPSYPGQGGQRGQGGWGGGYRGSYHREHGTGNFSRAYENSYQPHPAHPAHPPHPYHHNNLNNNSLREDGPAPTGPGGYFPRRGAPPERPRRPPPRHPPPPHAAHNGQNNYNSYGPRPEHNRYSTGAGPQWQARGSAPARHSFGGFDAAPLDMRTAPPSTGGGGGGGAPLAPPPAPPAFPFADEEAEQGSLVIDTEKYDPTEPTVDEDSGDETEEQQPQRSPEPPERPLVPLVPLEPPAPPCVPLVPLAPPPEPPALVAGLLAGLGSSVPANVLDTAVRQVLEEHRGLLAPARAPSDDDSDGDCPNFSIYSAASVHIANSGASPPEPPQPPCLSTEEEEKHPSEPVSPVESPVEIAEAAEQSKPEVKNKDDEFKLKVSKRCPITPTARNPIKIKLNTTSLIKKTMSLYDDEEVDEEVQEKEAERSDSQPVLSTKYDETPDEKMEQDFDKGTTEDDKESDDNEIDDEKTPKRIERLSDVEDESTKLQDEREHDEEDEADDKRETDAAASDRDDASDKDDDNASEELRVISRDSKEDDDKNEEGVEKMTESISETEDERSYTPCLDENKSKDTSFETDKDKNLEGLDTEMISEEEGNDIFSDAEKPASETEAARPTGGEEGEIVDRKKEDDGKKKKKKESKKEGKEKKGKKKADVSFKKLSKSGKERNYRDKKDKDKDKEKEEVDAVERKRRKEKRKDLERYDVRTVVTEKRNKVKDAFGRDVSPPPSPRRRSGSPRRRSMSPKRRSITPRRRSITPRRRSMSPRRRSVSPRRRSISARRRSISPRRRSISPRRRSISPRRRSISPRRISPRRRSISQRRRSISPRRRSISPRRRSISPRRRSISPRRKSVTPRRGTVTPRRPSISPRRPSASPARKAVRKSASPRRKRVTRRRRSASKPRKRRRSASPSPKPKPAKKKKRRATAASPPPAKKAKRKRAKRDASPSPVAERAWSPASVDSRLLSPRTPPPRRARHPRRPPPPPPAKEVFTSGDNILVSVSFQDQERGAGAGIEERRRRREARRERRRRRRLAAPPTATAKPVAIIDLERSPFAEIPASPRNVIVLSDGSDRGEREPERPPAAEPAPAPAPAHPAHPAHPAPAPAHPAHPAPAPAQPAAGPKTPPSPAAAPAAAAPPSPDAYDPFEPTRSPSPPHTPPRSMTLETAQKTNLSADDVIDRRPITPIEKVMALLQSTRDVSPEPPPREPDVPAAAAAAPAAPASAAPATLPTPAPAAPAPAPAAPPVRIVLPSPTRSQPKLFLAKPSPIKSNPVKPMQATKISRLPLPLPARGREAGSGGSGGDSPYSPGSSDFGDLFSPPGGGGGGAGGGGRRRDIFDALLPDKPRRNKNKLGKKKGNKMQVGVQIAEDSLKILDELPSSAVEMQVKSKFLKKLNRQERVVEEVKLVLKPHYNRKRLTKDQYKQIMRRAVPKICHNKTGEINPAKIQALVEAYVKKFRKKNKLGLPT